MISRFFVLSYDSSLSWFSLQNLDVVLYVNSRCCYFMTRSEITCYGKWLYSGKGDGDGEREICIVFE